MPKAKTRAKPKAKTAMLDHAAFARLRLADFFPELRVVGPDRRDPGAGRRFRGDAIVRVDNWEFDEHTHVGELLGFTEVLRTTRNPERTRSIAIAINALPARKVKAMLTALGLPLERGMTARALGARLGKPAKRYSFAPGQERFEFKTTAPRYRINCSVEKPGGLSYVVVTRLR